jgi:hypothetical protein
MARLSASLIALALFVVGSTAPAKPFAWPHRILIQSLDNRTVAFRAFTVGGELPITVDAEGRFTQAVSGMPRISVLTEKDTVRALTPGEFYVDVGTGPVVLIADDSVRVTAGFNPFGSVHPVFTNGRRLTVKLVDGRLFIDTK